MVSIVFDCNGMSDYDQPPYYYIAYIDEAGDPGLDRVRPIDEPGASEWLVIGAVLTQAKHELSPVKWVRSILKEIDLEQAPALHFRELSEWRKPIVCRHVADLPLRIFALLSNKKNMKGHTNPRAAAKGNPLAPKQYFYNYCLRLLLERVTDYCFEHSMYRHGAPRHLKVFFSRRKHSYGHLLAYNEILKAQSRAKTTLLDKRTIRWEVIDRRLQTVDTPDKIAGLQLADVVASSFYQAVDILPPTNWNPNNAKLLRPRVATEYGFYLDYGIALQPTPYGRARLKSRQYEILEHYGFDGRDF